jgi:hypothetical protein
MQFARRRRRRRLSEGRYASEAKQLLTMNIGCAIPALLTQFRANLSLPAEKRQWLLRA